MTIGQVIDYDEGYQEKKEVSILTEGIDKVIWSAGTDE
jgi:hypothetical protein